MLARRGDLQSRCTRPRKGSLGGRRAQSWTDTWLTYGKSAATSTAQPHATPVRLRFLNIKSRLSLEAERVASPILKVTQDLWTSVASDPSSRQSSTPLVPLSTTLRQPAQYGTQYWHNIQTMNRLVSPDTLLAPIPSSSLTSSPANCLPQDACQTDGDVGL
jgi:hypothetical protein